jgi:hypothetical protein
MPENPIIASAPQEHVVSRGVTQVFAEPKRQMSTGQQFRAFLGLIQRTRLGRMLQSFGGKRNYQEIFGWDATITIDQIMYMYNRGGIAKRVVDAYPDATWARPPRLWADGDDEWTAKWDALTDQVELWDAMYRLDRLASLGQYSVLVIGTDRPNLSAPLTRASQLLYLQPYGQQAIKIEEYDRNSASPNFGKPLMYRINPDGNGLSPDVPSRMRSNFPRESFLVHHSRVIHCARGTLEDGVWGQPAMVPIWDYLTDLRKVVGSSSESYWIMANRGLQADVDKEMSLNAEDAADLSAEIDEFYHGYRRYIRTKGVKLTELANDVADPSGPFDVLVTLISGATGIPKRILLGSEAGQLASTQDKGNWAEKVEENRALHVEPHIIKPFVRFLIDTGILPKPAPTSKGLNILWPDAYRMSPLERGQTAAQTARTIANLTKMLESENENVRNLISSVEARALIGFPSDNRILRDNPDP